MRCIIVVSKSSRTLQNLLRTGCIASKELNSMHFSPKSQSRMGSRAFLGVSSHIWTSCSFWLVFWDSVVPVWLLVYADGSSCVFQCGFMKCCSSEG